MPTKHEYNALLDTIYAAAGDPRRWSEALTRTSDYLGANGGMLIYIAPHGGRGFTVLGRMSEELDEIFWQRYTWNPWSIAMKGIAFDSPVAGISLVERRGIQRTGFYADVLKPAGVEEMLAATVRSMAVKDGVGGFSFGLSERGVERTAESLRRFSRLLPHLTRAFDTSLQLGRYADGTRQLARALELMPGPALLLDAGRRITYANRGAEALLRMNDGLTVTPGGSLHLAAALPSETSALERALAEALSVANGDDSDSTLQGPLRLTRPSGRAPLLVLPVPLPAPAFAMWALSESARAMVLVIDPEAQSLEIAGAVQTAFGLTAAEARIAALIGGGLSGPQTAAATGLSTETVKTHLARCFAKTGVHSQAGLVRLIGMLPRQTAG
jgi:DNA-binding CsgD family transcriptional regulator/PAS domain-containing protein